MIAPDLLMRDIQDGLIGSDVLTYAIKSHCALTGACPARLTDLPGKM